MLDQLHAVLVLEDGRVVEATTDQFKIDWRYDISRDAFVDVSGSMNGEGDVDADQEDVDDGSQAVPGYVSEPDGTGASDPINQEDRDPRGLDPGEAGTDE